MGFFCIAELVRERAHLVEARRGAAAVAAAAALAALKRQPSTGLVFFCCVFLAPQGLFWVFCVCAFILACILWGLHTSHPLPGEGARPVQAPGSRGRCEPPPQASTTLTRRACYPQKKGLLPSQEGLLLPSHEGPLLPSQQGLLLPSQEGLHTKPLHPRASRPST